MCAGTISHQMAEGKARGPGRACGLLPSTHNSSTLVSRLAAFNPTAKAPNMRRPTTKNLPQFF